MNFSSVIGMKEIGMKESVTVDVDEYKLLVPVHGSSMHSFLKQRKSGDKDREPCFMKLLQQEVTEGMTVFEVGANIGYQTICILQAMNKQGTIHAFEPYSQNFRYLYQNISNNHLLRHIFLFNEAVSNNCGEDTLHINATATNLCSLRQTKNTKHGSERVRTTDLITHAMSNHCVPNFIKMDIEGDETKVFQGLYPLVAAKEKFFCRILLETHSSEYGKDNDFQLVLSEYFRLGFKPKYVVSATEAVPPQFQERGYEPCFRTERRAIFQGVKEDDVLQFIDPSEKVYSDFYKKEGKIVRFLLLERNV